ncbi:hypothetical protein [Dietzia lutea]|uniref:hypothetical protein n=1 Tax=Dietzia lutea TaxID=546160 RepID=UPI00132F78BC|nr:hypothetical protein [Dietzia lutea]
MSEFVISRITAVAQRPKLPKLPHMAASATDVATRAEQSRLGWLPVLLEPATRGRGYRPGIWPVPQRALALRAAAPQDPGYNHHRISGEIGYVPPAE